jgi:hypothetical protein
MSCLRPSRGYENMTAHNGEARSANVLHKAVVEIGHGAMAVQADAANPADIDRLQAAVKASDRSAFDRPCDHSSKKDSE